VAWREGRHVEAEMHGRTALASWREVPYPLRWAALWPLLGVACARGQVGDAITYARDLSAPLQQRLPAPLSELVDQAVRAWDVDQPKKAVAHLDAALAIAREDGYA
jgi:hypothetical protein